MLRSRGLIARRGPLKGSRVGRLHELVPYDRQLFQLGLRKPFEEHPTNPGQVGRGGLRQPLETRLGNASEHLARITFTLMAFEQPLALEPIYHAGKAAAAKVHGLRQFGHLHPAVWGYAQLCKHVEGRQWQPVGGLELGVELLDNRGVCANETRPRSAFLRRALEPILLVSCTCNHQWCISRVVCATLAIRASGCLETREEALLWRIDFRYWSAGPRASRVGHSPGYCSGGGTESELSSGGPIRSRQRSSSASALSWRKATSKNPLR